MQRRSFPNSFRGHIRAAGYEHIRSLGLTQEAERIAGEAVALLRAPECPSEVTTLVLDSSQVILQMHESIGHPIELDRVLGMEEAYAGTSFLTPDDRGKLRYGSDRITVVADATLAGGLGTFALRRRGRGGPADRADRGRHLPELHLRPRHRAGHRPAAPRARCGPTAGRTSRSSG